MHYLEFTIQRRGKHLRVFFSANKNKEEHWRHYCAAESIHNKRPKTAVGLSERGPSAHELN